MKKAIHLDSPKDTKGNPIVNSASLEFNKPNGIVSVDISKKTGLLPKNKYDETRKEIFIVGTQPTLLSDSLNYNFYPTRYRENDQDSLIIDLGGKPYVWPDSIRHVPSYPDTTRPNHLVMVPEHVPPPIDFHNAMIMKNHRYVTRPESLMWKGPNWLDPDNLKSQVDSLNSLDALMDSLLKANE